MEWTPDQQKVIDLRERNILVSAAAGSGKTAVLVARIISLISEGEHPIDIDRLLIVTFTNAAAAEMRERIAAAIERKVAEMPGNLHLQKQMTLIHSAQITTIHSFCLNVIRNHFNTIDLDPSFRIADDAELTLMKSDVIAELLEEYYDTQDEDFVYFAESFSGGKSDIPIEELILRLYEFSMSYPWPEDWLTEQLETFCANSVEEMAASGWMTRLISNMKALLADMRARCEGAIRICREADGPSAYLAALRSDEQMLNELAELTDYGEFGKAFGELNFARLSGKKEEGVSEDKKNRVKLIREEIKKTIGDIRKNYFFQPAEEMLDDIRAMRPPMKVLVRLVADFSRAFAAKKADKNIVDFNDLEHFALRILAEKTENKTVPTPAADELSEHYKEILIDEYQDSNLVQETILNSISGERFGRPNLFMVGDVKQSIYKFRLARPELFMEKYRTYDTESSRHQRIDLHRNFRSREVVLSSVNFIFGQIMTSKLGNIEYDGQAALYTGADFGKDGEGVSDCTEIMLVPAGPENAEEEAWNPESAGEKASESFPEDSDPAGEEEYTAKEIEAKAIAKRIKELTDPDTGLLIRDRDGLRRAEFRDIVILLRTMSNWSDIFADILTAEGIPAHTETQSGYFSTLEIRTILNLLKIIDNPRQDIPLTAILRSPIVDLSSNDLAVLRIASKDTSMYEAVVSYIKGMPGEEAGTDNCGLCERLNKFMDRLEEYRRMVCFLSIHELILKVLDDTGYYDYISAMPAGDKRRANVDMLVQRAIRFESTSYRGLFHFIRYIEKLDRYDVDFGEARIVSENDNTVRIMSIHKSKGLEFPIVFAAGLGKCFNNQDSKSKLLIHPDLGLGPDYLNPDLRVKAPTLVKKVIQKELVLENLGEELRVLYVALTRAKEKLILTGSVRKPEDKLVKWANACIQEEKQLLFCQLSNAACCFDWIIPAVMRHRGFRDILMERGLVSNPGEELYNDRSEFLVTVKSYGELVRTEFAEQISKGRNQEELINWNSDFVYDGKIRSDIGRRLEFKYPYETETNIHTKLTVSELKKLGQYEEEELGETLKGTRESQKESLIPAFIRKTEAPDGAELGTLYHKVLEHIRLSEVERPEDIGKILERLLASGKILEAELAAVDIDKIYRFSRSAVAKRMRHADGQGRLYAERQFIMGIKACEINSHIRSSEMILVQGVIDVYFEEEDQLVILDYKTDHVRDKNGEKLLAGRYSVQLNYYQKALEQLTGKTVKEKIIYSFALDKEIRL